MFLVVIFWLFSIIWGSPWITESTLKSVIEVVSRLLEPFERSERGEVWRGVARRGWGGLTDLVNRGLQIAPQIVQKSIPFSASSLGGVLGEKG